MDPGKETNVLSSITRYALLTAAAPAASLSAVGFAADEEAEATAGEDVKPVTIERICWSYHPPAKTLPTLKIGSRRLIAMNPMTAPITPTISGSMNWVVFLTA